MTARSLSLAQLREAAGDGAALKLVQARGGTEMKFSTRPGSVLVKVVGAEAAKRLTAEFGSERNLIPMGNLRGQKGRQAALARLMGADVSASKAALATDVHERTAWRVRAKLKTKLPLFDK